MAWRDVTVFISSTFRDMHAERDYLVKEIFPELSDWCAARQLRLTDIDLRWGVTAEDARARSVVAACLHNIDDCRPFFLCLIGQRRGWVPTKEEIAAATYEEYPTLSRRVGRMSITEMEIEHALLAPLHRIVNGLGTIPEIAQRSLFCLRNEGCVKNLPQDARAVYYDDDPAEYDALLNLRRTVNDILSPTINYSCRYGDHGLTDFQANGKPLRETLLAALQEMIAAEFPDRTPGEYRETEAEQQDTFLWSGMKEYLPRAEQERLLVQFAKRSQPGGPLLLTGEAGVGKTTLLCGVARELIQQGASVIARFCGASDRSDSIKGLLEKLFFEAGMPLPSGDDAILDALPELFAALEKHIILLDGLDQIPGGLKLLDRIPSAIPLGLNMIVGIRRSAIDEQRLARLKNGGCQELVLDGLSGDLSKRQLVNGYLSRYFKKLDEPEIRQICAAPASGNPLFLNILLSELRVSGSFEALGQQIAAFGDTPESAFSCVMTHLEAETSVAKDFFTLIAASRAGLSIRELVEARRYLGTSADGETDALNVLIRRLRPFLSRRSNRVDFRFDSLRRTARARYAERMKRRNSALSAVFRGAADPSGDGSFRFSETSESRGVSRERGFSELVYHMHEGGEDTAKLLTDFRWLRERLIASGPEDTAGDFYFAEPDNRACILLQRALWLSAAALSRDPNCLPEQLLGRLMEARESALQALLIQAGRETSRYWLQPLKCCLASPWKTATVFHAANTSVSAICPHGQKIAAAYTDGTIRLWDIDGGVCTDLFSEPGVSRMTSDDTRLYLGTNTGRLIIWIPEARIRVSERKAHRKAVSGLALRGKDLISSSADGTVRRFDKTDLRPVARVRGFGSSIYGMDASEGYISYGGKGGHLTARRKRGLFRYTRKPTRLGYVGGVAIAGDWVAASLFYPRILFRNLKTGKQTSFDYENIEIRDELADVYQIIDRGPYLTGLTGIGKGFAMASPASVFVMRLKENGTWQPDQYFACPQAHCLCGKADQIFAGCADGAIRMYSVDNATLNADYFQGPAVGAAAGDGYCALLDPNALRVFCLKPEDGIETDIPCGIRTYTAMTKDDKRLYLGTSNYIVEAMEPLSQQRSYIRKDDRVYMGLQTLPDYAVTAMAATGDQLWFAEKGGALNRTDATGIEQFKAPVDICSMVVFNDTPILAKKYSGSVDLFDPSNPEGRTIALHKEAISCLYRNGDRLYSASLDGTVAVWDLNTWQQTATCRCGGPVYAVAAEKGTIYAGTQQGIAVFPDSGGPPVYFFDMDARVTAIHVQNGIVCAGTIGSDFLVCAERGVLQDNAPPIDLSKDRPDAEKQQSIETPVARQAGLPKVHKGALSFWQVVWFLMPTALFFLLCVIPLFVSAIAAKTGGGIVFVLLSLLPLAAAVFSTVADSIDRGELLLWMRPGILMAHSFVSMPLAFLATAAAFTFTHGFVLILVFLQALLLAIWELVYFYRKYFGAVYVSVLDLRGAYFKAVKQTILGELGFLLVALIEILLQAGKK